MSGSELNPIIKCDYPDPDVIRVEDTYYMVSTTMYFMPGGAVLRSYDLANWELVSYIFDSLDESPEERLEQERTNYGCGMWAPCLRYKDGTFYCAFVSHKSKKTYLFTTKDITGKWDKHEIEGYYHDCSLLFDDDGRNYLVYGNTQIHLIELDENLTGPKEGGVSKVILTEPEGYEGLGYEGTHFYKINGKYYLFMIHWPKGSKRTQACFSSDKVDGEYVGGDVLCDDRNYCGMGVAQGGIVDTPNGKWYSVLFQDMGAVGRIPVLVPVKWKDDMPVFGVGGKVPKRFDTAGSRPYYRYESIYTSDKFEGSSDPHPQLKLQWQWNHCPDDRNWRILPEGGLAIKVGKISANLTYAVNTLTQRMMFPKCEAEVTVDGTALKEGDVAGICALQGCYGYLGITKIAGVYYLIKVVHTTQGNPSIGSADYMPGELVEKIRLKGPKVTLCLKPNFENMADKLDFFYLNEDGRWIKVGNSHKLFFKLDHFTGCRFGLFVMGTRQLGGEAVFTDFKYRYEKE